MMLTALAAQTVVQRKRSRRVVMQVPLTVAVVVIVLVMTLHPVRHPRKARNPRRLELQLVVILRLQQVDTDDQARPSHTQCYRMYWLLPCVDLVWYPHELCVLLQSCDCVSVLTTSQQRWADIFHELKPSLRFACESTWRLRVLVPHKLILHISTNLLHTSSCTLNLRCTPPHNSAFHHDGASTRLCGPSGRVFSAASSCFGVATRRRFHLGRACGRGRRVVVGVVCAWRRMFGVPRRRVHRAAACVIFRGHT